MDGDKEIHGQQFVNDRLMTDHIRYCIYEIQVTNMNTINTRMESKILKILFYPLST